jgi:hypothetical protein
MDSQCHPIDDSSTQTSSEYVDNSLSTIIQNNVENHECCVCLLIK